MCSTERVGFDVGSINSHNIITLTFLLKRSGNYNYRAKRIYQLYFNVFEYITIISISILKQYLFSVVFFGRAELSTRSHPAAANRGLTRKYLHDSRIGDTIKVLQNINFSFNLKLLFFHRNFGVTM